VLLYLALHLHFNLLFLLISQQSLSTPPQLFSPPVSLLLSALLSSQTAHETELFILLRLKTSISAIG